MPTRTLILFLLIISSFTLAQPAAFTPSGPPETSLAGIEIRQFKIEDAVRLHGKPDGIIGINQDPYPPGTKMYKWGRLTVTLHVLTQPVGQPPMETITAIQIKGQGDPQKSSISQTGRGLKLGSKASEIKKLYGDYRADGPNVELAWPDGTRLTIHLNDKSRIDQMELTFTQAAH
jgi:hypothetical protein